MYRTGRPVYEQQGGVVCQSPARRGPLVKWPVKRLSNLVKSCQISSNARLGPLSNAIYPRSPVKSPPSRPPHASQNPCKSAQKGNTLLSRFGIVAEPLSSRIYCGADLPSSDARREPSRLKPFANRSACSACLEWRLVSGVDRTDLGLSGGESVSVGAL